MSLLFMRLETSTFLNHRKDFFYQKLFVAGWAFYVTKKLLNAAIYIDREDGTLWKKLIKLSSYPLI